ncbi:hypothetical protein HYQ46_005217 [Verticillium longisporum]|nr:hypothetical protein HYQ44_010980 [Verticillium longisporum]KAG7146011.1 hypothetical protein HYQ46_005217 [Verticillium longisporum]
MESPRKEGQLFLAVQAIDKDPNLTTCWWIPSGTNYSCRDTTRQLRDRWMSKLLVGSWRRRSADHWRQM